MTSWIKELPRKPIEKTSFLYETTQAGFCSQFNNYFYSAMYASAKDTPLYVNDTSNAVSLRFPLIKNTFVPLRNVTFTDTNLLSAASLLAKSTSQKNAGALQMFLANVDRSQFRKVARQILVWEPSLLESIHSRLVPDVDVGVHMRAGDKIMTRESTDIPVETYIKALKKYQETSKKAALRVLVMTDSANRLEEFKKKKDPSWTIVNIAYPTNVNGHNQRDFNEAPRQKRMNDYLDFIAELVVMQKARHIVCTFSSNVGRFLYLTADDTTSVVSVDMPAFAPI